MTETQRLFIAIPIPDNLQEFFLEQQPFYANEAIRFVPAANLHLTVHFLGEVPNEKLDPIAAVLQKVAASQGAFMLHLKCLEPGPKPTSPRLIWARFEAHPVFTKLCTTVTTLLGVKAASQEYIPHITLARFRKDMAKPVSLPIINKIPQSVTLPVNALALWQSELKSPHPVYRILAMYPLQPQLSKPN